MALRCDVVLLVLRGGCCSFLRHHFSLGLQEPLLLSSKLLREELRASRHDRLVTAEGGPGHATRVSDTVAFTGRLLEFRQLDLLFLTGDGGRRTDARRGVADRRGLDYCVLDLLARLALL